ncbi:hypothetical protein TRIUR3_18364 [Triticum urartu]|uniref:Uncharacterized protein n=1 Tax=Triticum urartu TaxID=4572 RepID=M7ZWC8_TRIUA|nr:hypothetical protein TRIUR3_18364 [Triticum urartu]
MAEEPAVDPTTTTPPPPSRQKNQPKPHSKAPSAVGSDPTPPPRTTTLLPASAPYIPRPAGSPAHFPSPPSVLSSLLELS